MVSNDDVNLTSLQSILQEIKNQTDIDQFAEHIYTVPDDTKWSLMAAYINQGSSDQVLLRLEDLSGYSLEIWRLSADRGGFLPENKMTIPAGWKIKFAFAFTTVRFMTSNLLVEEEQIY